MPTSVHPTAVVDPAARIAPGVEIGPYAVIGPHVDLGARTRVASHAVVVGRTTLGEDNEIHPFSSIGAVPQDLKYEGEPSELVIGRGNRIREFCSIHPGTRAGGMVTRIGDGNLLMNYSHVGHDCRIGDSNVIGNGSQLGGHVVVEDWVRVSALSGVHQFVRVGESAIVGAGSMVSMDVPPYCNATGDRATLRGLNLVGLQRRGMSEETISAIKRAYRTLFRSRLKVKEAIAEIRSEGPLAQELEHFVTFVESSERGVCR